MYNQDCVSRLHEQSMLRVKACEWTLYLTSHHFMKILLNYIFKLLKNQEVVIDQITGLRLSLSHCDYLYLQRFAVVL